jgi:hypothetical protein
MATVQTSDWVKGFIASQGVAAAEHAEISFNQAMTFLTDLSRLSDWQPTVSVPGISTDVVVSPFSAVRPEVLDTALDIEQFTESLSLSTVSLDDIDAIDEYNAVPELVSINDLGEAPEFSVDVPSIDSVSIGSGPAFSNPFDDAITIPTFDVETPTLSIPEIPDLTYPTDPGEIGELEDVDTPTMRELEVPDIPEVSVDIPEAPSITVGEFNEEAPDMTLTPPSNTFFYEEPSHESLRDTIIDAINEVTGYSADAEDATWERARARLETVNERTYNEALDFWASRGWILPNGALTGRLADALAEQTRADEQLNYELLIEADKINIDARKFKATSLIQLEQVLVEYVGGVATRAYQAAVSAQEVGIKVYEASVGQYNILLTKWRTAAEVYKTTIEAGLIELEKFKAQMEGAKVEASVKQLLVDIYNGQVNVLNTYANIYRVEMDGAKIKSDISLNKLAAFREKVNVYTAKLNAESVKYDAIKAKISGEATKAALYEMQVKAYEGRVKGIEASVSAKTAQINGYLGEVEAYKAEASIEKTKADIGVARIQAYRGEVDAYLGKIEAYKAKGSAEAYKASVASSNAQIMGVRSSIQKNINDTKIAKASFEIENNKLELEEYKTKLLAYSEWVKIKISELDAKSKVYGAEAEMYMGDVKEANVANEALIKSAEVSIRAEAAAVDAALKEADSKLNSYLKYQEIRQDSMRAGASVAANLAASAMNAINTTAGIGYDASSSNSYSHSDDHSISETHSYQEYCDPSCTLSD